MAGDDAAKKLPSIPDWQKPTPATSSSNETSPDRGTDPTAEPATVPELDSLEHARRFLDDESIKNASRDRKVAFLEKKGLKPEQIEELLASQSDTNAPEAEHDLKTVHDSTTTVDPRTPQPQEQRALLQNETSSAARLAPRTDVPPIITYPEFLLKPQKPPPLVTFDRLANAAYILTGLAALTYGASKYLVQPMLESLTDARHDLAITAQESLSQLNSKLESSVSRVPYIPTLHNRKLDRDTDTESVDSDPTELFHRDIATQTSPAHSRSSSLSSTVPTENSTVHQSSRLAALHSTLKSLLSSTNTHFAEDALQNSLTGMQAVIDKLESTAQPLDATYASPYSWQTSSTSKSKHSEHDSQAMKFKADIRALKGAFLSSRNFPAARPAVPFTLPAR